MLERAGGVMTKRGVGDASHTTRLRLFVDKCEAGGNALRSLPGRLCLRFCAQLMCTPCGVAAHALPAAAGTKGALGAEKRA